MSLIPRHSIFDVDNMFDELFPSALQRKRDSSNGHFMPSVDIEDHESSIVIKADLPGMNKEDVHVSLHDGVLSIAAEHREETSEEKEGRFIRRERRVGRYARSFTVAKSITENDINGTFADGVLTLTIPKITDQARQPQKIEIS
jgi:HSP20 family protein